MATLTPPANEDATLWYYTKLCIAKSPSSQSGIDAQTERRYRREGAQTIIEASQKLGLRYEAQATGAIYFHRFYMMHSFKNFPRYPTAAAALFLAGKVEETPKKVKDIIKSFKSCIDDQQFLQFGADPRDEIFVLERILLKTIEFDLMLEHPYSFIMKYTKNLKGEREKFTEMAQMAWTFVNDSLCTTLCLQWEPEIIAISFMYLASRLIRLTVTDWEGKKPNQKYWWCAYVEDLPTDIREDICHQLLDLYSVTKSGPAILRQKAPQPSKPAVKVVSPAAAAMVPVSRTRTKGASIPVLGHQPPSAAAAVPPANVSVKPSSSQPTAAATAVVPQVSGTPQTPQSNQQIQQKVLEKQQQLAMLRQLTQVTQQLPPVQQQPKSVPQQPPPTTNVQPSITKAAAEILRTQQPIAANQLQHTVTAATADSYNQYQAYNSNHQQHSQQQQHQQQAQHQPHQQQPQQQQQPHQQQQQQQQPQQHHQHQQQQQQQPHQLQQQHQQLQQGSQAPQSEQAQQIRQQQKPQQVFPDQFVRFQQQYSGFNSQNQVDSTTKSLESGGIYNKCFSQPAPNYPPPPLPLQQQPSQQQQLPQQQPSQQQPQQQSSNLAAQNPPGGVFGGSGPPPLLSQPPQPLMGQFPGQQPPFRQQPPFVARGLRQQRHPHNRPRPYSTGF